MPVPTARVKLDKSREHWRVNGVLGNAVLIAIGLEKLEKETKCIHVIFVVVIIVIKKNLPAFKNTVF